MSVSRSSFNTISSKENNLDIPKDNGKQLEIINNPSQQNLNLIARARIDSDNEFFPEAEPIFRRGQTMFNKDEEDLYKKNVRHNTNKNLLEGQDGEMSEPAQCEHVKGITDWKCDGCGADLSKFDLVFDDMGGKVCTNLNIHYENSFLDDFKSEFISSSQRFKTVD